MKSSVWIDANEDLEHVLPSSSPDVLLAYVRIRIRHQGSTRQVHACAYVGGTDSLAFFPLCADTVEAQDVPHPDVTGRVAMFESEQ
jgi:hypothetical protein